MATPILRLPAVRQRVGLSKSTIHAKIAAGEFPPPIRLSTRAVAWIEAEVDAWIEQRIANTRGAGRQ